MRPWGQPQEKNYTNIVRFCADLDWRTVQKLEFSNVNHLLGMYFDTDLIVICPFRIIKIYDLL